MNPEEIILEWAAKHPEVIAVVLGGSRAKGTHKESSDYDFSINLNVDPTPELVEKLCADLAFEGGQPARTFPLIDRHFILAGKSYTPKDHPEITMGFVNLAGFIDALECQTNHALVDEMFEFIKYAKIVYDPNGEVKSIQEKANIDWARQGVLRDAMALAQWNVEKYEKADDPVVRLLIKSETLWNITRMVAAINNIPLGSRYDYRTLKNVAGEHLIAPPDFFNAMSFLAENEDTKRLAEFVQQAIGIANEFLGHE